MISPAVIMGLRDRPVENVHLHFGMMSIYQHTPAAMENATATAQGNTHSQIHTHCSMIHPYMQNESLCDSLHNSVWLFVF